MKNPFKKFEDDIKKGINRLGDDVRNGVRQAGSEVEGGVKRAGSEVEGGVKRAGAEVEGGVRRVGHDIEGGLRTAGHEVEVGLQKAGREAEEGIRKAAQEVETTFEDRLPDLVVEVLPEAMRQLANDLASEAMKPALKAAARAAREWHAGMVTLAKEDPELVTAINSCGFKVTLKINVLLVLFYSGFYTRAQTTAGILDRYAHDGIAVRRRDIIGFIESTGPTFIDFGVGAEVSLGVDAGVTFELTRVPLKLFTRLGDRGLKALGVPA